MPEKELNVRIQHKHDIEANWAKATNFIPKQAELVIYDPDTTYTYPRIKVGDGVKTINELSFIDEIKANKTDILDANGTLKDSVLPEGYPYMGVGDILSEIIIPIDPDVGQGIITDEFQLYIGNSYTVNYNNIEYTCEAKSLVLDSIEFAALGNIAVMDESGETESTDEPFLLINASDNIASLLGWYGVIMSLDGSEEVTLSIHGNITKKISKEFLPNIPNISNIIDGSKLGSVRTILTSNVIGYGAHAEGVNTTAFGDSSHAEGNSTNNAFDFIITEESTNEEIIDAWNENKFTLALGIGSHAEGQNTLVLDSYSHAEGRDTIASGSASHAEGEHTEASGDSSHAEGYFTTASGNNSHAEGESSKAYGRSSHAEGQGSQAEGQNSHAEGNLTHALGYNSHAEGDNSFALSYNSHAEGDNSRAAGRSQHVQGEYNVVDPDYDPSDLTKRGKYAHIVGNGTDTDNRSNAHTIDWNGLGWFAGGLKVGGTGQDDPNANEVALKEDIPSEVTKALTEAKENGELVGTITEEQIADALNAYLDEHPLEQGVSIDSVLKESSSEPGGTNSLTILLSDGNSHTISVKNGYNGTNGITPHIGNNGNWFIGNTDTGKPSQGDPGVSIPGDPGYTPVKGVDYWTTEDKTEIVNAVLAELPTWTGGSY